VDKGRAELGGFLHRIGFAQGERIGPLFLAASKIPDQVSRLPKSRRDE
jgi:hypothetical protein